MHIFLLNSDSNQVEKNFVRLRQNNAQNFDAHTVYQDHMMKIIVNDVNVKIHAAAICAQMIQNVPLTFHKWTHHLHQFAEKVS